MSNKLLFILTILFACIIFLLIAIIVWGVIYYKDTEESQSTATSKNDPSGWQLYMLKNCGHCTKQMAELKGFNTFVQYERGNPVPIINNIEGELYSRDKINGFPFWYNSSTGEAKSGRRDVCSLSPQPQTAQC